MSGPDRLDMSAAQWRGAASTKRSKAEVDLDNARLATEREAATLPTAGPKAAVDLTTAQMSARYQEAKLKAEVLNAQRQSKTLTEAQAKASNFYQRTYAANNTLDMLNLPPDSLLGLTFHNEFPKLASQFGTDARNLTRDAVTNFLSATLRVESGAAIGPVEFVKQYQIYFPGPGAGPKEIAEKSRLRKLASFGFRTQAGEYGSEQADTVLKELGYMPDPKAPEKTKSPVAETTGPIVRAEGYVPPSKVGPSDAKTTVTDLPLEGQREVLAYINVERAANRPLTEAGLSDFVNNTLDKYGVPAKVSPGGSLSSVNAVNKGGRFGGVTPVPRSLTTGDAAVNAVLQNPIGGAIAGGVLGSTASLLPEAVGLVDPEAQARMERTISDLREENPGFTAGEIGGFIAGTAALGGALAPGLKAAGVGAESVPVVANTLFGTTQGAAEAQPGNRLGGAASGLALTLAGEALSRGASRVLKPKTPEEVKFLRERGVTLTPGQTFGGRASRVEEILAKTLLGGGDIALAARRKAFNDYNTAFLNEGGSHIGFKLPDQALKPTERMKLTREAFDKAYDNARSGMSLIPDANFSNDVNNFSAKLTSDVYAPENAARLKKLLNDQVLRRVGVSGVGGDEYKSLSSLLSKRRAFFEKAENADLVDGVADLQDMVEKAARASSPAASVNAMDAADRGYAYFARARDAGRMAGSDVGAFTPKQLLAVERARSPKNSNAFTEGETLASKWAENGDKVLGNVEPDSGTATRLTVAAPVTAASSALLTAPALAVNAGVGLLNTPGIKQGVTALLAGRRPQAVENLGGLMQRYQPQIGAATAGGFRERNMLGETEAERLERLYGSNFALSPAAPR